MKTSPSNFCRLALFIGAPLVLAVTPLRAQTNVQGVVPTGSPATANPVTIGGVDANGNAQTVLVDASAGMKVQVASTQRTPSITTATASGSVPAGARKLTFIFSNDFAGSVLGSTFSGTNDASVTIDAPAGDTLAAVAYTITAGSLRIVEVQ